MENKKLLKILVLMMILVGIPIVYGAEIGNYNFQGTGGVAGCGNGGTDYVCQKHKFYKAGLITNVTLPIDVIAGQYQFFVSTSKDSLNEYQNTLQNITGNWQQTRALENNFTVTANQELWFCMNYYSGAFEQYRCGYTDSGDSQDLHHRYPLNQVSVGENEFGMWYGSSFPLKTRANASEIPLASVTGGYIYSDGTGNLWGEQGIESAMSTQNRGEVFQFPDENRQILNLTMFIESDCDTQNYVKYGLTHEGNVTDIVSCSYNCSANIGAFPELVTCDVSAQNKTITIGDYYIYAQCFTDETLSTPCPTTDINMPTSRTLDGVTVAKYHDWQSYGRNNSYFVNQAYADTPFMIGYSDLEIEPTVCETWDNPYYLRYSFVGYPNLCGWITSHNYFLQGSLIVNDTTDNYFQYAYFDPTAYDTKTEYVTVKYDLKIDSITEEGSVIMRLYDDDEFNAITFYGYDGIQWYYSDGGTGTYLINITSGVFLEYKFIIGFEDDTFEIFINNSLIKSGAGMTDDFLNLQNLDIFKIIMDNANAEMDNLSIYASDSEGNPLAYDEDVVGVIQNETTVCGLYYQETPVCSEDSDCISGKCTASNTCSRMNYNLCIEKGWSYPTACTVYGTLDCGFESAGEMLLNKFWYFLIFLVILMIGVYLSIWFRSGNK